MAFHKSNLGLFGESLPCDIRGYVPEGGDDWQNFTWDGMTDWDSESWEEFVESAVNATEAAESALAEWQDR